MESNFESTASRWKKPLIIGGVFGLVIICAFAVVMSRTDLGEAGSQFDKNKADAEKEGLFLTVAQIDARYKVPESENGARLISDVLPLLAKLKLDKGKPVTEAILKEKWADLEPAIATIEEASHRSHLMFRRDFSNPAMTLFPEYASIKDWVKLLVPMGHLAAEKGDLKSAERYWTLAAYLATKTDEEGTLISILVRIAMMAIIEKEIQKMASDHGRDPKVVSVLDKVLTKLDQPYDMKMPLRIENWFATSMVESLSKDPSQLQSLGFSSSLPAEVRFGAYLPGFKKANLSRIYQAYADAVRMIPADPYDLKGAQQGYESLDKASSKKGLSYTMSSILLPVFSQSTQAVAREIAQRNAIIQAVALLKSGADPAAGLPLKDRHSVDIDGKPIRLKKVGSNWVVYSIGMDHVDDGGAPMDTHQKGDYSIRLPNKPGPKRTADEYRKAED